MGRHYTVWKGRVPGVYDSWEECSKQTNGFAGAEFKAFKTRKMAEEAFRSRSADFIGKDNFESELTEEQLKLIGNPILDSVVVDAAWNNVTGKVEYQGIDLRTKKLLFHQGPFEDGTNNIGEFLAIVHALAYCKEHKLTLPIYSDSRNAIGWVNDKEARTSHEPNEKNKKLFAMIDRAIKWLNENKYPNQILKWETKAWGENPADFGRK
jgi:ribonuclease HI